MSLPCLYFLSYFIIEFSLSIINVSWLSQGHSVVNIIKYCISYIIHSRKFFYHHYLISHHRILAGGSIFIQSLAARGISRIRRYESGGKILSRLHLLSGHPMGNPWRVISIKFSSRKFLVACRDADLFGLSPPGDITMCKKSLGISFFFFNIFDPIYSISPIDDTSLFLISKSSSR